MSWRICTDEYFMNQENIFPTAQKHVLKIIQNAMGLPSIEKIIVFGSATKSTYTFWKSDIDICVFQNSTSQLPELIKGVEQPVDYIPSAILNNALKEEVMKGVTVYVKDINGYIKI